MVRLHKETYDSYIVFFTFFSLGLSWPLNYHLMFEIIVTLALGIILFSLLLPKTIEKKREQDTTS